MMAKNLLFILLFGLFRVSLAQSGNALVDALVAHLRVSPFLVQQLNRTLYTGTLNVQDQISISNISAENLLNLKRQDDATVSVDAIGKLHLRTSLLLSDIVVKAAYTYRSWLNIHGLIAIRISSLTMDTHTTVADLTTMTLKTFHVRNVSPPKVLDFSGTSALFNWFGAQRVEAIMVDSTKAIVENIENFVRKGMSSVLTAERHCVPSPNYAAALTDEISTKFDWSTELQNAHRAG